MATIAVEMPATTASPEQAEALLRACSIAAAPDRCEAADQNTESPVAFAVVTWHGELVVRVEVGRPGIEGWLERRMTFAKEDPLLERWQAVGFAIGTLYGTSRESQDQPDTTPSAKTTGPPPARESKNDAPASGPARPAHTVQLGALGRVGTGTESSARFGGGLYLAARHAAGPFVAADANLDLLDAELGMPRVAFSARFVSVGISIGTALSLSRRLRLDLSASPVVEYQWMWTDESPTPQSRLVGGVRANVTLAHRVGPWAWLGLGAQMGSRFGDTSITIDGQRADSIPLIFATLALSLSVDLWRSYGGAGTP